MSLKLYEDTFTRTVTGGLGTADSGQLWTVGVPSGWNVTTGEASYTFPGDNTVENIILNNTICVDSDQVIDVTPSALMAGSSCVIGFLARTDLTAANGYWLRAEFDPDGFMTAKIAKREAMFSTTLVASSVGVPYTGGTTVRVRASVVGSRLAIKIWPASDPEPREWNLTTTDRSFTGAGLVGMRFWLVGGNTTSPLPTVSFDNYQAVEPRFHGEISSWPARWDVTGNDVWVPVEASGLLRRLNQGQKPLSSPIFRNLSQHRPTGYLPLEDGFDSTAPASGISAGHPGQAIDVSFAADDSLPGAVTAAKLTSGTSSIVLTNKPTISNDAWSVLFYFKMDPLPASPQVLARIKSTGTVTEWVLTVGSTNFRWVGTDASGSTRFDESTTFGTGAEPTDWVAMQLNVSRTGGNIDAYAFWYGLGMTSFYTAGHGVTDYSGILGKVASVTIGSAGLPATSVAHVAAFDKIIPFIDWEFINSTNGYIGETAGRRILRLSAENGTPVDVVGDPDDTEPMGRQKVGTFKDLINTCVAVDGGILTEVRNDLALSYRTRSSMYNQSSVGLSYAAGHISEPFEPVEDDDFLRNDVTVSRDGGSSARVALESGPLSILPAPDGVGVYDEALSLNLAYDDQAEQHAAWRMHLGTVDEARYPRARVNLASEAFTTDPVLTRQAAALDCGDLLSIDDLPDWLPPGPVPLMIQGYTERLDAFSRDITWNATPGSVWSVATVEGEQRVDSDSSVLAAGIGSSDTSFAVSSDSDELWTTDPAQFPLDILVGGEQMTVSAISSTSSPQTFAVTRAVNGVVKAHSAGASVHVANPAILGL
ncbi:hypothetical protein [Micromonospora sp. DT62]|uniref:hypothetical protein n=1 Tax=Micromonospora sp. DT62 TaxID=3416521 RepID=UPI003CE89EC4